MTNDKINAVFCFVLWPTDTLHFLDTDSDMYSKLTSGLSWSPKHIFLSKLCVTDSEETFIDFWDCWNQGGSLSMCDPLSVYIDPTMRCKGEIK